MKILPFFIEEVAGGKIIHLDFRLLPESWEEILLTAVIQGAGRDVYLSGAQYGFEVDESYPDLSLAGILPYFESIPGNLAQGSLIAKMPFDENEPYYELRYDYVLLSAQVSNAQTSNPFNVDNFLASRLIVSYGVSSFAAYLENPGELTGYITEPFMDDFLIAYPDPEGSAYQYATLEIAARFNELNHFWNFVNLCMPVFPFPSPLAEGHLFALGCLLHYTSNPYVDTLNGYPSWGYSCGAYPSPSQLTPFGCFYQYVGSYTGLIYSSLLWGQVHGIEDGLRGVVGSRFPYIFKPLPPIPNGSQAILGIVSSFIHAIKKPKVRKPSAF